MTTAFVFPSVLLHFTWLHSLSAILDTNELRPRWSPHVCLTRDQNHIYSRPEFKRDAVLVLDKEIIRRRHRLIPDHGDIWRPKDQRHADKWREQGLYLSAAQSREINAHGRECEERVPQRLRDVRASLIEIVIHAHPGDLEGWRKHAAGIIGRCAAYGIPLRFADFEYGEAWLRSVDRGTAFRVRGR